MIVMITIISLVSMVIMYKVISYFHKIKKAEAQMRASFIKNHFTELMNIGFEYKNVAKYFGKTERATLNDQDLEVIGNVLNVKPFQTMPDFVGMTLYPENMNMKNTHVHHMVILLYKKKYITTLGEKEFFSIVVELHSGRCEWDGEVMRYPNFMGFRRIDVVRDNFEAEWSNLKAEFCA